jgi:hypothetical protein
MFLVCYGTLLLPSLGKANHHPPSMSVSYSAGNLGV